MLPPPPGGHLWFYHNTEEFSTLVRFPDWQVGREPDWGSPNMSQDTRFMWNSSTLNIWHNTLLLIASIALQGIHFLGGCLGVPRLNDSFQCIFLAALWIGLPGDTIPTIMCHSHNLSPFSLNDLFLFVGVPFKACSEDNQDMLQIADSTDFKDNTIDAYNR